MLPRPGLLCALKLDGPEGNLISLELKEVQIYEDGSDKGKCLIINKVPSHMNKECLFFSGKIA